MHHKRLEEIFLTAPVNTNVYHPNIKVEEGKCTITMDVNPDFFHAGNSLHGSVYFKLMDDAAYFAAQSVEKEKFLLTASYQIKFLRPVTEGHLEVKGTFIREEDGKYLSKADLYNNGKLVGQGRGFFAKSKIGITEL